MRAVVRQYLTETTAHGISRLVGDRPLYIKLFWCFASLTLACWFAYCMSISVARLQSRAHSTAVYTEAVDFHFPDVYICPINPVSGSYPLRLSQSEATDLQSRMDNLRRRINGTWVAASREVADQLKVAVNSLPYRLLADRLGHRLEQMIPISRLQGLTSATRLPDGSWRQITWEPFYHPNYLRCARAQLSALDRTFLRHPINQMEILLLADAHSVQFSNAIGNVSVVPEFRPLGVVPTLTGVSAGHWSLSQGWDPFGAAGLKLLLTEPGIYPGPTSASLLVAPGSAVEVRISMEERRHNEAEFAGEDCLASSEALIELINNPYNHSSPYAFQYSIDSCYFRELLSRQRSILNCTDGNYPTPVDFLPPANGGSEFGSCYNWTLASTNISAGSPSGLAAIRAVSREASIACSQRYPCRRRAYSLTWSAGRWPYDTDNFQLMQLLLSRMNYTGGGGASSGSPSRPLFDLLHRMYVSKGSNVSSASLQTRFNELLSSQALLLKLSSVSQSSTLIDVTLAFTQYSMFAEIGGILGLYLGCSLLTVVELLELLHNLCCAAICLKTSSTTTSGCASVAAKSWWQRWDSGNDDKETTGTYDEANKSSEPSVGTLTVEDV